FFSSRRRHTRSDRDWSSDVCSSDLKEGFTLGSRVLVFDKVRVDPQAPGAYGARITYNIPLDHSRDSASSLHMAHAVVEGASRVRSEERRVGKECRAGWWRDHYRKTL